MKYTNVQLKTMRRYVGERIAEVRKKRSPAWTQFDLAMASGCRPEAISRVERGASDFGISYVFRIAAALEVNPADLMPYPGAHPSPDGSSLHSDMTVHET